MSFLNQEYFCAAPWTSIYINPDGRVAPCCISKANFGNINEQDISTIMAGPGVRNVRKRMLENQPEPTCDSCWRMEYQYRLQQSINNRYVDSPIHPNLDINFYSDPENFTAKYLDFRWNNTCNFACIYCGPDLSSVWAEMSRDHQNSTVPIQKNRRMSKDQLLEWTEINLPSVYELQLAGGEPLMIKENVTLLEQIKKIKPECRLLVNTNLSQLDNNPVFEILKQLPNVIWLISGESTGAHFEYIRYPGKWEIFEKNLFVLKSLRSRGHRLNFNLVGMNLNCFSIWDYIDFILQSELVDDQNSIRMPLQHHRDVYHAFALERLPQEFKDRINERVAKSDYRMPELQNYLIHLNAPAPRQLGSWSGLEATIRTLATLDRDRGIDSRSVFPDIYQYVDNHPR